VFAREASSSDIIKGALADVVFLNVDCEKGEGPAIAAKFSVRGYPTFYAVNGQGEPVERWIGYDGAEAWAKSVAAARADTRTLVAKRAAFEVTPTAALALSLANDAAAGYDFPGSVGYFKQARDLDPARADEHTRNIFTYMFYGADDSTFTFDEIRAEADRVLAASGTEPADRVEYASMVVQVARKQGRLAEGVSYLKMGLEAAAGLPEDSPAARTVKTLKVDHALLVENDVPKAVGLRKAMLPENWEQEPKRLNQFAWWCFENNVNLEEAGALAMRAVELADSDADRADYLDTAAEICLQQGNCEEAIARIRKAIALVPDRDYFKEQLAKFEAALKQKKG
jgi:tetratricopeptide (TPR) repeat protein